MDQVTYVKHTYGGLMYFTSLPPNAVVSKMKFLPF